MVEVAVPVTIEKVAAIEDIGAGAADQTVVPETANEHVVAAVADQRIAKDGPDQVLDAVIGIAGCDSGVARGIGQVGRDARADRGIKTVKDRVEAITAHEMIITEGPHEQVVAHAADKGVAAAQSVQNVIAGPTHDCVGNTESPDDEVIVAGADHALYVREGVARVVADATLARDIDGRDVEDGHHERIRLVAHEIESIS